jgi:hypothetical protein
MTIHSSSASEELMFVSGGYQCVQNDIAQMQAWLEEGSPMAIQISLTEQVSSFHCGHSPLPYVQFYDYSDPTLASTTVYPYDSTAAESVVIVGYCISLR